MPLSTIIQFYVLILLGVYGLLIFSGNPKKIKYPVLNNATADLEQIAGKKADPVDIRKAPDEAVLAQGKALYQAQCSFCHGDSGKGDGPAGGAMDPKPRNFHNLQGWIYSPNLSGLFETLTKGAGKGMAAYDTLPAADRIALAHYVQTMMPEIPLTSEEELNKMDQAYNLTKGESTPSQIPVTRAILLLSSEATTSTTAYREYRNLFLQNAPARLSAFGVVKDYAVLALSLKQDSLWQKDPRQYLEAALLAPETRGFLPGLRSLNQAQVADLIKALEELSRS